VSIGQHQRPGEEAGDRKVDGRATMPSDITDRLSMFDRFATQAGAFVSWAWFFVLCLLLVLLWAPSILLFGDVDTWQLIINTVTTIVTFLLVALLQNTQKRADDAVQHKLKPSLTLCPTSWASWPTTTPACTTTGTSCAPRSGWKTAKAPHEHHQPRRPSLWGMPFRHGRQLRKPHLAVPGRPKKVDDQPGYYTRATSRLLVRKVLRL
jgi:Low affinity iron permease